jgi:hypothetical protein
MNTEIKWTKTYGVFHEKGAFKAFTSEHGGKHFYATILYFEHKTAFNVFHDDKGAFDFKQQTFYGASETEALEKLREWLQQHLPGKYEFRDISA